MYFILSGEAEVISEETISKLYLSQREFDEYGMDIPSKEEQHTTTVINRLTPGHFFGEVSIIFSMPCTATIRTTKPYVVSLFPVYQVYYLTFLYYYLDSCTV